MTCNTTDLKALAYSHIASEYKNSVRLIGHMNAQIVQQQELLDVFCEISEMLNVDTATGAQLDIIGRIVGLDRVLVNAKQLQFFGFTGGLENNNLGFGDVNDFTIGGPYIGFGQGTGENIRLNDVQYRVFIKAKIITNNGFRSTPEELASLIKFSFNFEYLEITESTMQVFILIGDPLDALTKDLLKLVIEDPLGGDPSYLIPQTLSVLYHYGQFFPGETFSFSTSATSEFSNEEGFGDAGDPNIGGKYAGFF